MRSAWRREITVVPPRPLRRPREGGDPISARVNETLAKKGVPASGGYDVGSWSGPGPGPEKGYCILANSWHNRALVFAESKPMRVRTVAAILILLALMLGWQHFNGG